MKSVAVQITEQRREERTPLAVEVTLESDHNFYAGITDNVSMGGVFVATYMPPPMGTELELRLSLEGTELHLRGVVCWVREPKSATEYAPAGCGLRWVALPPLAEAAISRFVHKRETILFDDE